MVGANCRPQSEKQGLEAPCKAGCRACCWNMSTAKPSDKFHPAHAATGEIAYQNLSILSVFSYFIAFCKIGRQNAWKIDPSVLPDTSIPFQTWYSLIAALRNAGRSPRTGAQIDGRSSIGSLGGLQTLERSYNMRAGSCRKRSSHGTQGFRQRAFQSRRIQRS